MTTHGIVIRRTSIRLSPDPSRVLIRPFIPKDGQRIIKIISRVMSLPHESVHRQITSVFKEFSERHFNIETIFERHYSMVSDYMITDLKPSHEQKLLIGSLFTSEYALECAALFNPSIVPHPDQSGVADKCVRFIMSLRATGEGHISSITFREGILDRDCSLDFITPTRFVSTPNPVNNASYDLAIYSQKLYEMGMLNDFSRAILDDLEPEFTLDNLASLITKSYGRSGSSSKTDQITRDDMLWLAKSNYEIQFPSDQQLSQRIIFPTGPSEQNGIEDARFVMFKNDDGSIIYYATYTAYDGKTILPQLIQTEDFLKFKIITLNGKAVQNKGMALFPRKIDGKYVILSRQDNENLFIMYSENLHFWHEMIPLLRPTFPWEFIQVGNCGTPIETEEGWLVLTHGVGPMRKYCIGAILLDSKDPRKVLGRLEEPLLVPNENEREGYVPNVVYTCGAMVHNNQIILPYAMSDYATSVAVVDLQQVLYNLKV